MARRMVVTLLEVLLSRWLVSVYLIIHLLKVPTLSQPKSDGCGQDNCCQTTESSSEQVACGRTLFRF